MLVFPKNAEKNASIIEKGLLAVQSLVNYTDLSSIIKAVESTKRKVCTFKIILKWKPLNGDRKANEIAFGALRAQPIS